MLRYTVNISFDPFYGGRYKDVPNIAENVKTLKEAESYESIIDESVRKACIVDCVTGTVVKWLKQ